MRTYTDISCNYHDYKDGAVYFTLGIYMGVAAQYYLVNKSDIFVNNLAFSNIWVNYMKEETDFQFNVDRTVTSVFGRGTTDKLGEDLVDFLKASFMHDYDEQKFVEIKGKTIENFKSAYKSGEFRGWYKSFEISEMNKGFVLKNLINDLQEITYERFAECAETLITPYNSCMYVNGLLRNLTYEEIRGLNDVLLDKDTGAVPAARCSDPYLREDKHHLAIARESYNIDTVCFSFAADTGMLERMIYLEIETEKVPFPVKQVHLDEFDASVTVSEDELMPLKDFYRTISTEQQFEEARDRLLKQCAMWLDNIPESFGHKAVEMYLNHISMPDYLTVLAGLEYGSYKEVAEKIKPMVSEAQIVMRRC
ncbi:MAG: hypothetical protein LUC41_01855 [Clostridiales bacterium]|nr:hypothetical protein [Clostridiales bacterium]